MATPAAFVPISSRQNPRFKALKQLLGAARDMRAAGLCALEGEHLIEQAVHAGFVLETLVSCDAAVAFDAKERLLLPVAQMGALCDLASPPICVAIAKVPARAMIPAAKNTARAVIALDRVQDPTNVGAILRTAAAAGIEQAWLSDGCAYAWSQKTLRASQGAQCHLTVHEGVDLEREVAGFKGRVVVTTLNESRSLYSTALTAPQVLFVVGNEGEGVSPELAAKAHACVRIPMQAGVESLNVAAATAVVLFEWRRQMEAEFS